MTIISGSDQEVAGVDITLLYQEEDTRCQQFICQYENPRCHHVGGLVWCNMNHKPHWPQPVIVILEVFLQFCFFRSKAHTVLFKSDFLFLFEFNSFL